MTIREHLEDFPEPYKTQALKNTKKIILKDKMSVQNRELALSMAFVWEDSPEGLEYWSDFYYKLENENR